MNDLLQTVLEGLKRSSLASKLTAGLVAMAIILAVGVSAIVSNRPHYQMLLSGLSAAESASAMSALADAGIPFEASQPPGPFVVYVDEDDRTAAMAAIYSAGAMIPIKKGIPGAQGGMGSVFMSNGERQQLMQKQLWGETEAVLESLAFVAQAKVLTSTADASPFTVKAPRRSATVQLTVRAGHPFGESQALTAVMMVSRALEIAPDDIVLTDQSGKLWNGGPQRESGDEPIEDWLEFKERYDERLADKANRALAAILGPNRGRVEVDSLWNFEQSTTSEQIVSDGATTSKTKNSTETPIGSTPTSAVGASSNVDFGIDGNAVSNNSAPAVASAAPLKSTSMEEKTESTPSIKRTEKVSTAPTLSRMSVALFLDSSIVGEDVANLEGAVKAAVGFDETGRADNFKTVSIAFAVDAPIDAEDPDATPAEAVEEAPAPNPMMQMLMRRGVEVLIAIVFIGLLLSTLKSSKKTAVAASAEAGGDDVELDPEVLAQAQVQELLTSDPERIGEILSQWARESEKAGAAR